MVIQQLKSLILTLKAAWLIEKYQKANMRLMKAQLKLVDFYACYAERSFEMKDFTKKQVCKIKKMNEFVRENKLWE